MLWFKPDLSKVEKVIPFFNKYDGDNGYLQCMQAIKAKYIAIKVNNNDGQQWWRVMKVKKVEPYRDFGGSCSAINYCRTRWVLSGGRFN